MKKRYAVFICAITFDNQRRILDGILRRAREQGSDVFVFTCHVNYTEELSSKQGAFGIMRLPDLKGFDGAILLKNSIQYEEASEELVRRILESGIPAVSIDEHIESMYNVGISSYEAERKIMEHLLREHGLTRINYVTGRFGNQEAKDRYRAYRDVLKENGVALELERVFFGNYDMESGRAAVREFLERDLTLPEAIVFANDAMAIGGILELEERGLRVPEDVRVAGFDDDEISRVYLPSLTTIDRRQEDIGYQAMLALESGRAGTKDWRVETALVIGESCGCTDTAGVSDAEIRSHYCGLTTRMQGAIDTVKNMAVELAGLENTSELYEKLKKYVCQSDMNSFYLCMCEEEGIFQLQEAEDDYRLDVEPKNFSFTEQMHIPLAYRNHAFFSCGSFPASAVLPRSCIADAAPSFYIVMPLAYQRLCFGYCVTEGSGFALNSELAYSWVVNIGIALENIRKWMLMDQLVKKLNSMWMYDMLTHIYNRMGFYHFAGRLLKNLRKEDQKVCLMFLDLDGLKRINDSLGHEYGDACICEMAETLREALPAEALLMRYGGDEFVVLAGCLSADEGEELVCNIKAHIQERNSAPERKYTLAASIGMSVYRAAELDDISRLIDQADKRMYEEKLKKNKR